MKPTDRRPKRRSQREGSLQLLAPPRSFQAFRVVPQRMDRERVEGVRKEHVAGAESIPPSTLARFREAFIERNADVVSGRRRRTTGKRNLACDPRLLDGRVGPGARTECRSPSPSLLVSGIPSETQNPVFTRSRDGGCTRKAIHIARSLTWLGEESLGIRWDPRSAVARAPGAPPSSYLAEVARPNNVRGHGHGNLTNVRRT